MADKSFSGGAKMEEYLRKLAAKITKPGTLRVGFLEGATYPNGTSVPMVAAINEFGAPSRGIPPRPYFRGMIADKSQNWGKSLGNVLKNNGYDTEKALLQMGEGIKGQLQQAITDFSGVPLAPATIARKGFSKQLVDTGHMLNSVDYEVKE